MEDTKLLMAGLMENREIIGQLALKHNELTQSHKLLIAKHNKLCKLTGRLCLICVGLDVLILLNAHEISKLKKKIEEKEKEG